MNIFHRIPKTSPFRWPDFLPFVRQHRYRQQRNEARLAVQELQNIVNKHDVETQAMLDANQALYSTLLSLPDSWAHRARILKIKPINCEDVDELCLFVTHAPHSFLKPHVIDHIYSLAATKIKVVLIVNTDMDPGSLLFPEALLVALHGCIVRENLGFDFGAWAHVFSLIDMRSVRQRLYFVNDSIVGPLDDAKFASMIQSIRSCDADLIGLTQNARPKWHLQSFFLVFNKRALDSHSLRNLMKFTLNLPTKQHVIDMYETQLSELLLKNGLRCQSIFAYLGAGSWASNDTHSRWTQLIDNGFPFIKASVLAAVRSEPEAIALVPEKYRASGTAEQPSTTSMKSEQ